MVVGEPIARTRLARPARWRRRAGLLALFATLTATAACGARWSDAERASIVARTQGGPAQGTDAAASGSTTTTVAGATLEGDTGGTTGSAAAGGTGSATTGGAGTPSGPRPCAAKSAAPGVTDTEITLGTISTISGPVPGLGPPRRAAAGLRRLPERHRRRVRSPTRTAVGRRRHRERPVPADRLRVGELGPGHRGGPRQRRRRWRRRRRTEQDAGGRHCLERQLPGRRRWCSTSTRPSPTSTR